MGKMEFALFRFYYCELANNEFADESGSLCRHGTTSQDNNPHYCKKPLAQMIYNFLKFILPYYWVIRPTDRAKPCLPTLNPCDNEKMAGRNLALVFRYVVFPCDIPLYEGK
ncbi:hypothetical protein X474_13515 [Dethiosulfatarculus sandiegensis]|uniref:Uncharacterized protein n=1 Tax=Dethiosulfatarculus sandiegensis TaxID=1429043 RepID=A0A0D2HSL3_9BACT|nr:hypothetical protein X474_13515 [Dethiosulfatarculus sandiegensis]